MGSCPRAGTSQPLLPLRRNQVRQRFVSLRWEPRDHHRWATALALVGLTIAAAMALFGLPPVDLHPPMHHLGIMNHCVEAPALLGTPPKADSSKPGATTPWASSR